MTRIPTPSPMTKPSRSRSKGREARVGVSLKPVERARAAAKPPRLTRSMQASEPPQTATSASPVRCGIADRLHAGGASGDRCTDGTLEAIADRDMTGREICEKGRHGEGREAPDPA